jgi:Kef-type K+ transport system membrane component KefB
VNELTSVGIILLISLLAGHLVKFVKIPEVTGYIVAGLVLGPSFLGWIGTHNVAGLGILSEVALGLILFSIGSIFRFDRFRGIRSNVVRITAIDTVLVFSLVFATMLLMRLSLRPAILTAIISTETAAASTLMVLREYNAAGPLTENLMGMIAINNVVCLTIFSVIVSLIQMGNAWDLYGANGLAALYAPIYLLVWQLIGSVALGYLIGVLLSSWAPHVTEHGETLILLIGSLLLCVGLSIYLQLSTLIASLAIGATAANFSSHSRRLAEVQSGTDPPFYAIFFVIAGANLHVDLLKSLGWMGAAYVLARAIAKILGGALGANGTQIPEPARSHFRWSTLPHAGLAIGLVISLEKSLPVVAPAVSTIVLAAVLIFEVLGPIATRRSLIECGENRAREPQAVEVLD